MDLHNITNYKYYKCRSLLACDTGGTVIDTTQTCNNYDANIEMYKNESQSSYYQSENIIYVVKADKENKSLVDSTTHLDDDEFNDYEMYSNTEYKGENEIHQHNPTAKEEEKGNFDYFPTEQSDDRDVQEIVEQILKSGCLEHCDSSNNSNSYMFDDKRKNFEEINSNYQSTSSEVSSDNLNSPEVEKNRTDSSMSHAHKRKQIYNVKMDSFSELLEEDDRNIITSTKNKKKKLSSNKENHNKKLNPFANVRMSSILKGNKRQSSKKTKNDNKKQRRESVFSSNEETAEEEIVYKTMPYFSRDGVFQELNALTKLNSEFTNADYFEYVQPRERIVESDMDKLLSPTIDVELSGMMRTCEIKQVKKASVDCNGNEIGFEEKKSSTETAEREFFLKSAYARKFGFENYFNTSNESVINEILFDPTLTFDEIKLDINFIRNIDLKPQQCQTMGNSFQSVSCTLLDTINDLNRFGDIVESNIEETENHAEEDIQVVYFSETNRLHNNANHLNPNLIFDFSNKSSLLSLDKCENNNIQPLKIKIKRVNEENNQYIIDDSYDQNTNFDKKQQIAMKSIKIIDRYECHDCSMKFRTKRMLKTHVSAHHRGPYDMECDTCHMKFKKSSAHKKHYPWCNKNVVHKCDTCDKEYCYRAALVKHLKSHKNNAIYYQG